jgi:hypothetical protein
MQLDHTGVSGGRGSLCLGLPPGSWKDLKHFRRHIPERGPRFLKEDGGGTLEDSMQCDRGCQTSGLPGFVGRNDQLKFPTQDQKHTAGANRSPTGPCCENTQAVFCRTSMIHACWPQLGRPQDELPTERNSAAQAADLADH